MENTNNTIEEEFEDALSLCDFAIADQENNPNYNMNELQSSQLGDLFEFSTSSSSSSSPEVNSNSIIFCGKVISCKAEEDNGNAINKQRYNNNNKPLLFPSKNSSAKLLKKTNVNGSSSSFSKSASSCRKVFIGLAKIPSKMELNDLRERQKRRNQTPPPMFPSTAVGGGEATAVSGEISGRRSHNWGVLKPFRFRAQELTRMLTRSSSSSLGCLRLARPCID